MAEALNRQLGRADVEVSPIGLGGFHLGKPEDPGVAVEMIRRAVDGGITFMDNSWDYHEGESERRMGRALRDGYRDRVFLMTKLDSRSRDGTLRQFEQSLERLEAQVIDLIQLHEVIRPSDPDIFFAKGGPIETYLELQDQGAVRFVGFTGHKDPAFHRRMIERGLEYGFTFDTVQMPVNPFDARFRSFSCGVMPLCLEHGIAVLGMKPLGSGRLLEAGTDVNAPELLRWAMSQPVSTVITGCESLADVEQALSVLRDFTPFSAGELSRIAEKTRDAAEGGRFEEYKTTKAHDGTARMPQWMA